MLEALNPDRIRRGWLRDPRHFQIAALAALLLYGTHVLNFDVGAGQILVTLGCALGFQWVATQAWGLPRFDPRSPLISGLSLCLLLRTDDWLLAMAAAALAVFSKFVIRVRGKHLFNPTNLALVVLMLTTDRAWVSAGQWGHAAWLAFLLACFGGLVIYRAERSDVTWGFLAAWAGILFGRALWLGDPLTIPWHQLQNGALLLFAFFMISDPKTTPDSRTGRLVYASLVALGAGYVQFVRFDNHGPLLSLIACAALVPVIDRLFVGPRYRWPGDPALSKAQTGSAALEIPVAATQLPTAVGTTTPRWSPPAAADVPIPQASSSTPLVGALTARHRFHRNQATDSRRPLMKRWFAIPLALAVALATPSAEAFCGFYVGKADSQLFNESSQVAIVRNGDRTVLTMANDYEGDLTEFAMVVPVPTFITREQIHVAQSGLLEHLDAFSAPRLVEYFDENPCNIYKARRQSLAMAPVAESDDFSAFRDEEARELGVTIEAQYTVGEYDILILSAEQSHGLESWLRSNGYRIPDGASSVLSSYIKQGNRFFVAKVNLEEQAKLGGSMLRPLQVAFESPKFMLPIRLGTVNAKGDQDLIVYLLTKTGRVETTNYRTVKLPTGMDIPTYVKDGFGDFYQAMFSEAVRKENGRAVFLEYAWNMSWCDPCAADPLSRDQLRELGVFWLDQAPINRGRPAVGGAQQVYITRLHVRYNGTTFPQDLVFQETGDTSNFQGRYVLRHPWTGNATCQAAEQYRQSLPARWEREAQQLAQLTGWSIDAIRTGMASKGQAPEAMPAVKDSWWKRLWN